MEYCCTALALGSGIVLAAHPSANAKRLLAGRSGISVDALEADNAFWSRDVLAVYSAQDRATVPGLTRSR